MTIRTLTGALWLFAAAFAVASAYSKPMPIPQPEPAIVPADCGKAPPYDFDHEDEWYAYGDCSGDYGPIDAAETVLTEGGGQ